MKLAGEIVTSTAANKSGESAVKKQLVALSMLAAVASIPAHADYVVVGDKVWRQLTDTTNFSWNQMATVCSATNGACSGTIGLVSVDGWTWASIQDVQSLFEALILPGTTQFPSDNTNLQLGGNSAIDNAVSQSGFLLTSSNPAAGGAQNIEGITRTTTTSDSVRYAYLVSSTNPSFADAAYLGNSFPPKSFSSVTTGIWMYQTSPVPIPAAGWLLISGMGGLLAISRRRRIAAT